ncbi:MAG: YeeE/YedE family protein [Desulfobulbaceae bacterium A2]|nr:MAG: YeeE/YedE family protein [Desulfobulbaceae bacterium A2]
MSEESVFWGKTKELYKILCKSEWNAMMTGIIVAFLSVLIMAWWRPWGAVGAIRNWGDWLLAGIGVYSMKDPVVSGIAKSIWYNSGSVIGMGFIGGAFISACLGGQFALRFPPLREYIKAIIAGVLMGVGSALAGGCNVGGMYNAIGNLAANGFTMWFGLVLGVVLGLKLLYMEMEYISWGDGGAKTIEFPVAVQAMLGVASIGLLGWGAYSYANYTGAKMEYVTTLSGMLIIAAGLGYAMQRGRWCMVQGFREPHMTGDCTLAKSVALSILLVAIGAAVLKYGVPSRAGGEPVLDPINYVRGTFGWGSIVGGFIFGLGAMFAGGCGSGSLWRVGEGQIKLWLVVPLFGISNSLMTKWFVASQFEDRGVLGSAVYLPDVLGYGPTLLLIALIMGLWYVVVTWNEETNKLIVPM